MSSASIAIVAAEFNKPLIDAMVAAASEEVTRGGAALHRVVRVPGCYEVPSIAGVLLARADVTAVVVLGFIERGETLHGEVMGHVVHGALMRLSLEHGKPVGLGIIGPGATPAQAEERKEAYSRAAVRAALASLEALKSLTAGE